MQKYHDEPKQYKGYLKSALIEMVVIDLGTGDDAHIIFETLNARGTPLRASDLVKN